MKKVTHNRGATFADFAVEMRVDVTSRVEEAILASLARYTSELEVRRDAGEIVQTTVDIQAYQARRFVTWMLNEK